MSSLEFNHYGKHAVRLLRVRRNESLHEVAEWQANVLLEGDLAGSFLSDDNSSIVPTDTVKNTVLALAHDLEDLTRDGFALALAKHFPAKYGHLTACDAEVIESQWTRMAPGGMPHEHCFLRNSNGKPFSKARVEKSGAVKRSSGLRDFVLMKTTQSGFTGFANCDLTTLPETTDRILATSMNAEWEFSDDSADVDDVALDAMLNVFSGTYSPSVQRTLFLMGEAALAVVPGLSRIKLTMPNKHYLNIDLTKLGRPAVQKKVFLPTDDPFGYIEAVIAR